jgi:hypothetical protein
MGTPCCLILFSYSSIWLLECQLEILVREPLQPVQSAGLCPCQAKLTQNHPFSSGSVCVIHWSKGVFHSDLRVKPMDHFMARHHHPYHLSPSLESGPDVSFVSGWWPYSFITFSSSWTFDSLSYQPREYVRWRSPSVEFKCDFDFGISSLVPLRVLHWGSGPRPITYLLKNCSPLANSVPPRGTVHHVVQHYALKRRWSDSVYSYGILRCHCMAADIGLYVDSFHWFCSFC